MLSASQTRMEVMCRAGPSPRVLGGCVHVVGRGVVARRHITEPVDQGEMTELTSDIRTDTVDDSSNKQKHATPGGVDLIREMLDVDNMNGATLSVIQVVLLPGRST